MSRLAVLPDLQNVGLPVYARGTTPIGPLHRGPGEINFPISCGGTVINPGDVIIADPAGIVAVPQDIVAEVLHRLRVHADKQAEYLASVRRGDFSNAWVDRLLAQIGCDLAEDAPRERGSANGVPADGTTPAPARP